MAEEFSLFTYIVITMLIFWEQQKDYPQHRGEWINTLGNQLVTCVTEGSQSLL